MAYPPPPYRDAVTGTFVAGEALTGTWWAYPPSAGLGLGALEPNVLISSPYVPVAGLGLGALKPTTIFIVTAPVAGLGLGAVAPAIVLSSILGIPAAGLGLAALVPDRAGRVWLLPLECLPIVLPQPPETELVLASAAEADIVLQPAECL